MTLYLHNTLTGKKEEFIPISPKKVGMYNCGPTVYNYAHIGNMRSYILADTLRRTLEWNGYSVEQIINITDVGHLTGDTDFGRDKLTVSAQKEGKTTQEIANFYTQAFFADLKELNIETEGTRFPKATEHIPEQIAIIETLEKKGFTYTTKDGIYFDTAKFPDYGKLGNINLSGLEEGARIEKNPEKRNPTDFALWKFSHKHSEEEARQQEWQSPWGVGFPGWHIECSAMSIKYLGETFDIHTGGIDHIPIHHNNEVAQSESATRKKFVRYWLHNAFVNVEGGKMAKSEGNFIRLETLKEKGIHPLSYRYFILGAHYKTPLNFNEEGIAGAQRALENIIREVSKYCTDRKTGTVNELYKTRFTDLINDDLDTPKAIALVYELLKDTIPSGDKLATIFEFDKVLGLNLEKLGAMIIDIPKEITEVNNEREQARQEKDWKKADEIRKTIEEKGFVIYDEAKGSRIERSLASFAQSK